MGNMTIYVFHPDRGEPDDDVSPRVQTMLERFRIENEFETYWLDCTEKLLRDYRRIERSQTFREYLLGEMFVEVALSELDEPNHPEKSIRLVGNDVAGFFLTGSNFDSADSVWQCLNPEGHFDFLRTNDDNMQKPLCTKTGRSLQSCLAVHLDLEQTPDPDVIVICNQWIAERTYNPMDGNWEKRTDDEEWNIPWKEWFIAKVQESSPNTRITAVDCHY